MSKAIIIKLKTLGNRVLGPFDITDDLGNVVAIDVTKQTLVTGVQYSVNDSATSITIKSKDTCNLSVTTSITYLSLPQINAITLVYVNSGTLWRHLTDTKLYNTYY